MSAPENTDHIVLLNAWRKLPDANSSLVFEFVQTLVGLDAMNPGLTHKDIDLVEAAWGHIDGDFYWMGGFIVSLRDGRRAYLEGFCDSDELAVGATVRVEMLPHDTPHESVARQVGSRSLPWEMAPQRLNEYLRQLHALEPTGRRQS
jgi:hypothetical protein